ncbi:MAG: NTP transferase domain-containing protein, partial [Candidatus Methanofastidiosa archaeon]|nr:NTP transferase domain-containing protein [Candidatus Methanofastidiosa archaeon]
MKAIILAGGFGTRLRPLTYNIPKCLLTIDNTTILEHQIRLLRSFDEIILATNYLEDKIRAHLKRAGVKNVIINNEPEPLGTAGAVLNAKDLLDDEFFVMNGDIVTDCRVEDLMTEKENAILVHRVSDISRYGNVAFGEDGTVMEFREKEEKHLPGWINAGLYRLKSDIFGMIPSGRAVSLEREIFPILAREGRMDAVRNTGYWYDVGTRDDFINANLSMAKRNYVLGRGSSVLDSTIKRSVIMDGCT